MLEAEGVTAPTGLNLVGTGNDHIFTNCRSLTTMNLTPYTEIGFGYSSLSTDESDDTEGASEVLGTPFRKVVCSITLQDAVRSSA